MIRIKSDKAYAKPLSMDVEDLRALLLVCGFKTDENGGVFRKRTGYGLLIVLTSAKHCSAIVADSNPRRKYIKFKSRFGECAEWVLNQTNKGD